MVKSGAEVAREAQSTIGTYDHVPSQGAFVGRLAAVLIAFLVICALGGIIAGIRG
jgi:hypothetical protein